MEKELVDWGTRRLCLFYGLSSVIKKEIGDFLAPSTVS
jgi:hypothetical protein